MTKKNLGGAEETLLVTAGRDPARHDGAVNVPVYHASTVLFGSVAEMDAANAARARDEAVTTYGRSGTPTTFALAEAICALEGGHRSYLYPSGMAAIAGALAAFTRAGGHILVVDNAYGPTRLYCDGTLKRMGVETTYFDPALGAGIAALIRPNTTAVFVEAPGSHTFEMQDIPAIADAAHKAGAVVLMDNTWATPLFFRALDYGVDVAIHSATKYIVGHADAMLGVATARKEHWSQLRQTSYELGYCAGPDDIYLAQRGLRTLAVRLARHQESGLRVAEWLRARPEVKRVLHPGLPGAPGHDLWKRDFKGATGLFAVELTPRPQSAVNAMLDSLDLFGIGASWGGFESLALPGNVRRHRTASPWTYEGPLVRFHIGLEAVDDLLADLERGFAVLNNN
jgi:cystathionine beta-lyase